METSTSTQSYRDILGNIGNHIKLRQKLIGKRAAIISGPLIVSLPFLVYGKELGLSENSANLYYATFFVLSFVSLWWSIILGQIFKIERVIWVDSFFDKVPLDDRQSWKLAKKLFWPSVLIGIITFMRYQLLPLLAYPLAIVGYLWIWQNIGGSWIVFAIIGVGGFIGLWVYFYLLKLRLRYINFLLVDTYDTTDFSYGGLYREAKTLNKTTKGKDFQRLFTTTLGTDVVGDLTNFTIGTVTGVITRNMGAGGKIVGSIASQYTAEIVDINKKLAQTVTFYLYYRVARQTLGKTPQTSNSALYGTPLTIEPPRETA